MFDLVIISHIPCFYKVNLFNKIAEKKRLMVIFISDDTRNFRSSDFLSKKLNFEHHFLNQGFYEKRNIFHSNLKLFGLLRKIKHRCLIVNGWELSEFWLASFLFRKNQGMILESSIMSYNSNSLLEFFKKIFVNNLKFVIASGKQHEQLLHKLNFKKEIRISLGVGLINKSDFHHTNNGYKKSFVYIGRVSFEKNLIRLVEVFNFLGNEYKLSIYGDGDQSETLKRIANSNISFLKAINNSDIPVILSKHDFLVLPSTYEPWGLVVEEALFYNTPVIVSNVCGCVDIVKDGINSFLFDPFDKAELIRIINSINEVSFVELNKNSSKEYIDNKDFNQVLCYY
jgi:glycosyltransferase involved in cell wall biosynthesis